MSTRTIIEINHDYLHELRKYPEDVANLLQWLGYTEHEAREHCPTGIRILGQRHHSETLKLTVK